MREVLTALACVLNVVLLAGVARAQEPDWPAMTYTSHKDYQAADASGNGTFPTDHPIKMRGVLINWPQTMLDTTPGSDPFMGGQWQEFIQTIDADDFGGTAMWMGQNIGKIMGNHPVTPMSSGRRNWTG
jgi:hypothetical protein